MLYRASSAAQPLGYALYFWDYSTWLGRPGVHIEDLWVDPQARHSHIATELVRYLVAVVIDAGSKRLEWVVDKNNAPGRAWSKTLGAIEEDEWRIVRLKDRDLREMAAGTSTKRDFNVRFATHEDARTLHHFIVEQAKFHKEPADAVKATPLTLKLQMQKDPPPFGCLLAEEIGAAPGDVSKVLGFALFFPAYSTWRGQPILHLEDVVVSQEIRGRGVGKALLQHLSAETLRRKCVRLEWAVGDWNENAIKFYDSFGSVMFEEFIVNRLADDKLMALKEAMPWQSLRSKL